MSPSYLGHRGFRVEFDGDGFEIWIQCEVGGMTLSCSVGSKRASELGGPRD